MDHQARIFELEDQLKQRDRTITELRAERDAAYALVTEAKEHVQDVREVQSQWIDAFGMVQNDKGKWQWSEEMDKEHHDYRVLLDQLCDLYARWNKFVPKYNESVASKVRNLGRPIDASPAQQADVLKRRKAKQSLRDIADDTELSLQTVRTIIDKADGVDRATLARLERFAPDKLKEARLRRQLRARAALPNAINALDEQAGELIQGAKGLR
jgi:hypothetical protein